MIRSYGDFIAAILKAGFSMGGGNSEGIYAAVPWNWNEEPPYETPVRWHTGDPETDPWEWRMRVLAERGDIAYAKVFLKKTGYIAKAWLSYFLAVRRGGADLEEAYADGTVSREARRIYTLVCDNGAMPLHELRREGGFAGAKGSGFERALTELEMKMYLTMCGRQRKTSRAGEEYGWSSTVFCRTEERFGEAVLEQAREIGRERAVREIAGQIRRLNPQADAKKVKRFIEG